jgi:chemotaxis protein CheX
VKVDFVNPFIKAAVEVVKKSVNCDLSMQPLRIESSKVCSNDVTVVIGVTGDAEGVVLYGMSERTAKGLATVMAEQRIPVFDAIAESAVAELGNMIAGSAASQLEEQGYSCKLTPPTLLFGRGTMIAIMDINRLVIPMSSQHGVLEISLALRDNK